MKKLKKTILYLKIIHWLFKRRADIDILFFREVSIDAESEVMVGSEGDLLLDSVTSDAEVRLKTEGGISEIGSGDSAIVAQDITIESDDSMIEGNNGGFRVEVMDGGKFSARSEKDINLDSSRSDLGMMKLQHSKTLN